MTTLLVKNIGILQTPSGSFSHRGRAQGENIKFKDAAVFIRDKVIEKIARGEDLACCETSADRVIDAGGALVTPGLVEGHTHLDVYKRQLCRCSSRTQRLLPPY